MEGGACDSVLETGVSRDPEDSDLVSGLIP